VSSASPLRLGILRVAPAFQAETDLSVITEDLGCPILTLCVSASLRETRLPGVHLSAFSPVTPVLPCFTLRVKQSGRIEIGIAIGIGSRPSACTRR